MIVNGPYLIINRQTWIFFKFYCTIFSCTNSFATSSLYMRLFVYIFTIAFMSKPTQITEKYAMQKYASDNGYCKTLLLLEFFPRNISKRRTDGWVPKDKNSALFFSM